jgi:peptidoglycan hydrolase CwlO-like protein
MSNDDPTTKLPDEAKYDTEPTIETVLARINELYMEILNVAGQVLELQKGQNELRHDVQTGFRKIERRLGVLSDDMNQVRADQRELESRVDDLEKKPV